MPKTQNDLSNEQKNFLAILLLIGIPVSAETMGELVSLSIKDFWGLINRKSGPPLICQSEEGLVELSSDFPEELKNSLRVYLPAGSSTSLLEQFERLGLTAHMKPGQLLELYKASGNEEKVAQYELELAARDQASGEYPSAIRHLQNSADTLIKSGDTSPETRALLIDCVFDLSILLFLQATFMDNLFDYFHALIRQTQSVGDRRNLAMAYLHLGSWKIYIGEKQEGLKELREGKKIVEEIHDDDILAQSLPFREFCVFTQGRYREVLEMYDQTVQKTDMLRDIYGNYIAGLYAGASAAFLGQFHRATGILDSNWHLANRRKIFGLSGAIRAVLGHVLLLMGKKEEAMTHLLEVKQEAEKGDYGLSLFFALGAIANYYLQEGNPDKACELIIANRERITQTGVVGMFTAPMSYEMFYEMIYFVQDKQLKNQFIDWIEGALDDINVSNRGVTKRLKAKMEMRGSGDRQTVLKLLQESELCLLQSEDPLQLAKTRIELARLSLGRGDIESSREMALKARKGLSGFFEDHYPTDLRFLLDDEYKNGSQTQTAEKMENLLITMIETLIPQTDCSQLMKQLLITINNFLQAKRIGLFVFEDPDGKDPDLIAGHNISRVIIHSDVFRANMGYIFKSFQAGKPLIAHTGDNQERTLDLSTQSVVCLPFEVDSKPYGVVYLDYTFCEHAMEYLNEPFLKKLSFHIGQCVERILQQNQLFSEIKSSTIKSSIEFNHARNSAPPVTKDKNMARIYKEVSKIAKTDATVLFTGETGTGKEFMAGWMHRNSLRADKPFIIIDPTTITENLFESELFGHEKGAFTGADRQKLGRIELADQGTLFIDELGEIPLNIQVKLLRVLQEKTFMRVGGTRTLSSDFRLIVATNRDLEKEVSEGRFREDLFYRINVMSFRLPALRERKEDIVPLAENFFKQYAAKYDRPHLSMSPENHEWLKKAPWPGNVRELAHTIEKAVLTSSGPHLEFQAKIAVDQETGGEFSELITLDEMQKRYISYVLKQTGGKISGPDGATRILGVKRTTLQARMKKLGVSS